MADRSSKHRTVAVDLNETTTPIRPEWSLPWYLVAALGPIAVLAAGWLLLAGPAALGWLTSPDTQLPVALELATSLLLLAHGTPVTIAGQTVSLVPLLLTGLLIVLGQPVAAMAAREAAKDQTDPDDTGQLWVDAPALVWRVAGTFTASYALSLSLLAALVLGQTSLWRTLVGGLVVGGIAGLWGSCRGVGYDPREQWPSWLRAVPTAIGAAGLLCIAGGAVILATALVLHRDRIIEIETGLEPGLIGGLLLLLLQLLYLPNLVLWATSWMLGAGFTLGDSSLINLTITDAGFLPAIPVFGALPAAGAGANSQLWWLLIPAVAGVIAALILALARPRARFDETALVGGLAGVSAGAVIVLLASLASGSLGSNRLAFIGAKVSSLAIVAPALLGLAGLVTGLVVGLIRMPRLAAAESPAAAEPVAATDAAALDRGPQLAEAASPIIEPASEAVTDEATQNFTSPTEPTEKS